VYVRLDRPDAFTVSVTTARRLACADTLSPPRNAAPLIFELIRLTRFEVPDTLSVLRYPDPVMFGLTMLRRLLVPDTFSDVRFAEPL